ncbi:hypothetical protein E2C01_094082 [Portunus trituberculatus]|uniref:Uncharacterized protein n=1 Tax=Portunus trituberculatus TaxID=210409 RepID=A0A5B7JRJ7_PORTR|nr:hypothetical protein [Portunus trituberculatus]
MQERLTAAPHTTPLHRQRVIARQVAAPAPLADMKHKEDSSMQRILPRHSCTGRSKRASVALSSFHTTLTASNNYQAAPSTFKLPYIPPNSSEQP